MTKPNCFVIGPFGQPNTKTRKISDQLLKHIIAPALGDNGYEYERADFSENYHDPIADHVSKRIFEDDLVIADLRDSNPNVYYELGKRHAWGGRSILLTDNIDNLPFDVRHLNVIQYNLRDPDVLNSSREKLSTAVRGLAKVPNQCPYPLTPEKVIALSGATVLLDWKPGRREHYDISTRLAETKCRKLFLMQRSSSLILGPEQNWGAEKTFYNSILKAVDNGIELYHIVSLEGLARHLDRPQSHFPWTKEALDKLSDSGGRVEIQGPNNSYLFRRIKDEEMEEDLKPDRQARTLLVEYQNKEVEGVLVVDLGGRQGYFHMRGPKMREFLEECISFYGECPVLTWPDLNDVLKRSNLD